MGSSLVRHLNENFSDDHRVVFWHDPKGEYTAELDSIAAALEDVQVETVDHNEFGIKARILTHPDQRYLVYRSGALPADADNWLLDLQLAYGVFTADKVALTEQRFTFSSSALSQVITDYPAYFNSTRRTEALSALVTPEDDTTLIQAKMCQLATGASGHRLVDIIRVLLEEHAAGDHQRADRLATFGLDTFLWQGIADIYHYTSSDPSINDFVLWLFERAYENFAGASIDDYRNIRADFSLLRNDVTSRETIRTLADQAWDRLGLDSELAERDASDLVGTTVFKQVDHLILRQVAAQLADRLVSVHDVTELVQARRHSLWFDDLEHAYQALQYAAELLATIDTLPDRLDSFDAGLAAYTERIYRVDQLYRWFTQAHRHSHAQSAFESLKTTVDSNYTGRYLYTFGQAWQQVLDTTDTWSSAYLPQQSSFFTANVAPATTKVVVIISDAMRYEIADELTTRIRQQDRCDAELSAMLGSLPSYTQLGMASLLPHRQREIKVDKQFHVLADDQRTDGSANRSKLLAPYDAQVMRASEVLEMGTKELRERFSQHSVFYVYHDRIDAAGDSYKTESTVFSAAEAAIDEIVTLIGKWVSANASTILVTADHGFLYQDCDLEPHFSLSTKPQAQGDLEYNRRFVVGHGLEPSDSYMTFQPNQLGLSGDYQVQVAKSIHRIIKAGAGNRYVHGGATLPEVVVPLVTVRKKRTSNVRPVNVDIMPETDKITTNQLTVRLLQREAVEDTLLPRRLRVGIYHGDMLISDSVELVFNSTDTDQRARYQTVTLYLNHEADDLNNVPVALRLEEPVSSERNRWKAYTHAQYTIKRSFVADFDF